MSRRLSTIAKSINLNHALEYTAKISEGYCDTDRKVGRLKILGKGRTGTKIEIFHHGKFIFSHNSAEPYRKNLEVEDWLDRNLHRKLLDSIF